MTNDLVRADDVREAGALSAAALAGAGINDWAAPAGDLEWTVWQAFIHLNGVLSFYTNQTHNVLSGPPDREEDEIFMARSFANSMFRSETPSEALVGAAGRLADAIEAMPEDARAWHAAGMADRSGYAAMGCDEILVHTNDLCRGAEVSFQPPDDLCRRVVDRLFPWSPKDVGGWKALLWANDRIALPGQVSRGADWVWHCAPLEEWDGTIPRFSRKGSA